MKKFFSLAVLILSFGFLFTGCTNDDTAPVYVEGDGDTVATVYEYKNVNFNYDSSNGYYYFNDIINPVLQGGEMVLIYIQSDLNSGGRAWVLLPNDVDYYDSGWYNVFANYDFTSDDFKIYITPGATSLPSQFVDITFRVMFIPGYFPSSKSYAPPVDYRDYNAVVKYFKIDESKIIRK